MPEQPAITEISTIQVKVAVAGSTALKMAGSTPNELTKQAFAKLSPEDQATIEKATNDLQAGVKAGHPSIQFTHDNALEVLACIGMLSITRKGLLKT